MEEGGRNVELISGGRNVEVTKGNVYDYVRKYAEYRMVRSQLKALEELRSGIFDVIPSSALEGKIESSSILSSSYYDKLCICQDLHLKTSASY